MTAADDEVTRIFAGAASSGEALYQLYKCRKAQDKKFSIAYFCKRAGIPSRGYFSDVMLGTRLLHEKYWQGIVTAFALSEEAAAFLHLLLAHDHADEDEHRRQLAVELANKRKVLLLTTRSLSTTLQPYFVSELVAAFGLYQGRPTEADLRGYFEGRTSQLELTLNQLEVEGLIVRDADRLRLTTNQILFASPTDPSMQIAYIKDALTDAISRVESLFPRPETARFESYIVSMRRQDLPRLLQSVKDELFAKLLSFETADGDMMLHFNLQAYPGGPLPK